MGKNGLSLGLIYRALWLDSELNQWTAHKLERREMISSFHRIVMLACKSASILVVSTSATISSFCSIILAWSFNKNRYYITLTHGTNKETISSCRSDKFFANTLRPFATHDYVLYTILGCLQTSKEVHNNHCLFNVAAGLSSLPTLPHTNGAIWNYLSLRGDYKWFCLNAWTEGNVSLRITLHTRVSLVLDSIRLLI